MNMMLAVGKDNGRSFSALVRLNPDGGEAARTMPGVAISSDGAVHAVWLVARDAPPHREEPANLYYSPRPASPPLWEIAGCPSVGPVVLDGLTLWKDGSQGFWRLVRDDLPEWAASAALDGQQLLVGNHEGRLRVDTLRLELTDG